MSNPTTSPTLTRSTIHYRNDGTRELHQRALRKFVQDESQPQALRDRAAKSLRASERQDSILDASESVIGERATQIISWPSRVLAGWLREHPDISNEDLARRANAYLAE